MQTTSFPSQSAPESECKLAASPPAASEHRAPILPPEINPIHLPAPGQDHSCVIPWVQPPMCWKDHLVIDRYGPPLPVDRCCKCNAPANQTIRKTFTSGGTSALVLVILIPILLPLALIFYFMEKCRASVEFGVCDRCATRRRLGLSMGVAILIGSVPLFVQTVLSQDFHGILWALGGMFALAFAAIVTTAASSLGNPKRIDKRWVVLKAGGKAFRESLPQSPIPSFRFRSQTGRFQPSAGTVPLE